MAPTRRNIGRSPRIRMAAASGDLPTFEPRAHTAPRVYITDSIRRHASARILLAKRVSQHFVEGYRKAGLPE